MTFEEVLQQIQELLQQEQRISYRGLKRRFDLDDEYIEDLKAELIKAKRLAVDEDGEVLVWIGAAPVSSSRSQIPSSRGENQKQETRNEKLPPQFQSPIPNTQSPAERRQLTVMFCDLVGSTALSEQLDPEELREVVRAYQETCTEVIQRYAGYIAQHLGDGLLVYFGYPVAHEDDAARAVRSGLEILAALQRKVPSPLAGEGQGEGVVRAYVRAPLQVRIGIHTGLVVIGEIGSSEKREMLALGETPNLAARIQGQAAPDEVLISAATHRLVEGLFACEDRGQPELKGVSTPLTLYRVVKEGDAHSRFEVVARKGLTPLVGRDHEYGLLCERWVRAKDGEGQVVLLSGEPGIGKSRLVQTLKEQVLAEGATSIEFHCSPYQQNSALYPIIDHLQRLLQFTREDTPTVKLEKLQQVLARYRFPQADTVPLLAALLSLPHPEGYPPITVSPQKQKEKTQAALVAWIVEEAKKTAVYCAWEDLHWADPSTLEVLTLVLDRVPTARLLALLTFRPEFLSPWGNPSHLSQLTLSRLGRPQVAALVAGVTGGKALPPEVVQQIVAKTDGVPLFVEELTKTVLESLESLGSVESIGSEGKLGQSSLQVGIPATLQDALMARLDRLGPAKELAQLGATIGREFSYELLQAVSPLDDAKLQQGLQQLVKTELVYQRGLAPQAHYLFKHALIQDMAYQSLLKSARHQLHRQIAQVLEGRFPETVETQPELVAQHYTEAGLIAQAIPYWQQAGQRAVARSANVEAITHFTKGLELLKTLPDTSERAQQELALQILLGVPLMAIKGWTAPEVERVYIRARELCEQLGETRQLFSVLRGLWECYDGQGKLVAARKLGKRLLDLAQNIADPALLVVAHNVLAENLLWEGQCVAAHAHAEQGTALYDRQQHHTLASLYGTDPGVACLSFEVFSLWMLGYPARSSQKIRDTLTLARELPHHPYSLATAQTLATLISQWRREGQAVLEHAEAVISLSTAQEFPLWVVWATIPQGWALASQGEKTEGLARIHQGLALYQAIGGELLQSYFLALLAETYGEMGQTDEGLAVLAEALAAVHRTEEHFWEAELYRLKGELTLQKQSKVTSHKSKVPSSQEAEAYFQKAIEIAQHQQAKSLELRAVMSLVRLRQQQATQSASRDTQHETRTKLDAARAMLAEVYNWFTEGFDTKDLQEAQALLEELT